MAQCLHGDGAKVVLSRRIPVVDNGQTIDADIFEGAPNLMPQRLKLRAQDGFFRLDEEELELKGLLTITSDTYSGYQRLADPEDDQRLAALQALAQAFVGRAPVEAPDTEALPAIYTYFGQFIAHEVSRLYRPVEGVFENLNTSSFDLDTLLYTPDKFQQTTQKFAPDCEIFGSAALGRTASTPLGPAALADLPRAVDGHPLVPDCRNDANPALSQLHVAILRKYRVLVGAYGDVDAMKRLKTLLHAVTIRDYLKEIIDECVYKDVLNSGRKLVNPNQDPPLFFLTPIEFAAGAFRFGHAMVRSTYEWSSDAVYAPSRTARVDGAYPCWRWARRSWFSKDPTNAFGLDDGESRHASLFGRGGAKSRQSDCPRLGIRVATAQAQVRAQRRPAVREPCREDAHAWTRGQARLRSDHLGLDRAEMRTVLDPRRDHGSIRRSILFGAYNEQQQRADSRRAYAALVLCPAGS